MRTIRDTSLISVATALTLALAMSITPAHAQTAADAAWINDLINQANSIATPEQQGEATKLATSIAPQFAGF